MPDSEETQHIVFLKEMLLLRYVSGLPLVSELQHIHVVLLNVGLYTNTN